MSNRSYDENYFTVYGWMVSKLVLKGVSLSVFAIVYGYTSKGNICRVSNEYMAALAGCTERGVRIAIQQLIDRDYLSKISSIGGVNQYFTTELVEQLRGKYCE